MPNRLMLTKNAQFYIKKTALDDDVITEIIRTASANKISDEFIIDKFRDISYGENDNNIKVSIRVFKTERSAYFILDDINDIIHAFLIIIECENYLAIFKKSCAEVSDVIEKYLTIVDSRVLFKTFSDEDVFFEKMALRNMTNSDSAVRNRSYEAANLNGVLSTHSAGRSIPYYVKIKEGDVTKTITSTGRLFESSHRLSIEKIVNWVKAQVNLINNPSDKNDFLDLFAKKIDLNDVLLNSNPSAILIESNPLIELLDSRNIELMYKTKKSNNSYLNKRAKDLLYSKLKKVHELNSDGKVKGYGLNSHLKVNNRSLTFHSTILKKIIFIENQKEISLQQLIIKYGFYSITFENPKYMYFMNSCFEDSSGISEIDSILAILHPQNKLNYVNSEKGNLRRNANRFPSKSMFAIIEDLHKNDDYVFCDDLGNEWADHITFNLKNSEINFIHSKHGKLTTSASDMHDVVSQAIKNLGNMNFTKEQFLKNKEKKFDSMYGKTQITRTRKKTQSTLEDDITRLLHDYNIRRKCIISCSFISKSTLTIEFTKIKNGASVRGHITQLFWIISSFAHAVRDTNAIPIIYCNN